MSTNKKTREELQYLRDETLQEYLNREDFQYDINADALYQHYKDQYTNLGKQAMEDTMGQASALTGGYGSSYAQNLGQQAYNSYMQQLDDVIPELYQLAYDRYRDKGEQLYQTYQTWSDLEQQAAQQEQWQQELLNTVIDTEQENVLEKPGFSHVDDEGLYHYYLGGKEVKYAEGVNPLTSTVNPDVQYGTFGVTGYQPSHITINGKVQKLSKSGVTDMINGHEQNVWQAEDESLWMWDDTKNAYTRYAGSKMVNKIVNTKNIDKFKQSIMPREAYGDPTGSDAGYKNYIAHKIDEADRYLTDDEVYTLGVFYGLIDPPENMFEKYGYHVPG